MGEIKITAFLAAGQLDIKRIKGMQVTKPSAESSTELFYAASGGKYQYYFNYGVVVFCGYPEEEMRSSVEAVTPFARNVVTSWLRDEYLISVEPGHEMSFGFEKLILGSSGPEALRIVMFNLAQSVAIDYYNSVAYRLLNDIREFANRLATTGRLRINRRNMMRFLGKSLTTENDIAENIYIFDAPDLVWDDEALDKLHQGLSKHFDLRMRYTELEHTLRIIDNNLVTFREITNQRENSLLEWIIIALILVEVFDLIASKFLH